MPIWILTIGNSDVQLNSNKSWTTFYNDVTDSKNKHPERELLNLCPKLRKLQEQDDSTKLYPAYPRVLGLLYRGDRLDKGKDHLAFPLLDTFCEKFDSSSAPSRVIVLLTDQSELFSTDKRRLRNCPFWQDTCELRETIEYYFKKFEAKKGIHIEPQFAYIKPHNGEGIDNWNEMLDAVSQTLDGIDELKPGLTGETIYVSHQAGTPAISSAVQFATISKFGNVQFLVSNQSYDGKIKSEPDIISSSKYWQGLQIQKAKQLIVEGEPGAALKVLKDIDEIDEDTKSRIQKKVDEFNIKATVGKKNEFKAENAVERIRKALDMIEIFFENENYIEGIVLLTAAQETFLKAAILNYIKNKATKIVGNIEVSKLIEWTEKGLVLKSKKQLEDLGASMTATGAEEDLASILKLPLNKIRNKYNERNWNTYLAHGQFTIAQILSKKTDKSYYLAINSNYDLIEWLKEWAGETWAWKLIENMNYDTRHQLVHNLRGVEPSGVVQYLIGKKIIVRGKEMTETVADVYRKYVKEDFLQALKKMELLSSSASEENGLKKELVDLANSIKGKVN